MAAARPFRIFVTATDTGVGKTEVSCALLELLRARGERPAAFKPYESGVRTRPADARRLWEAAGKADPLEHVVLHTFREPLAPGVAAVREGRVPPFEKTLAGLRRFDGRPLVMEGAGGLFVPVDRKRDVVDLIAAAKLPVVLVARAGLGTLNHSILSIDALAARRIPLEAVVLVKSSPGKDPSEEDNAEWIRKRRGVEVLGQFPFVRDPKRRRKMLIEGLRPLVARA